MSKETGEQELYREILKVAVKDYFSVQKEYPPVLERILEYFTNKYHQRRESFFNFLGRNSIKYMESDRESKFELRNWFCECRKDFRKICELAGFDPEDLREKFKEAVFHKNKRIILRHLSLS